MSLYMIMETCISTGASYLNELSMSGNFDTKIPIRWAASTQYFAVYL
jgi:hypothetical protein